MPIDVGQHTAMAKVIDFAGSELARPFEFSLDRVCVAMLVDRVRGIAPASVALVRVGLEAAGHHHLPLARGRRPVARRTTLLMAIGRSSMVECSHASPMPDIDSQVAPLNEHPHQCSLGRAEAALTTPQVGF